MPSPDLGEQIIISATSTPVVTSQTLMNGRGYAFKFPSLGLPDPNGEFVIIKAAIGTRQKAVPLVQKDSVEPPMRFAYSTCGMIDVKYDGAIWIVPLVSAYKKGNDATELFLLKARRLPLSTPYKYALTEVKDINGLCHIVHPRGMEEFEVSAQTTSSDDKAFWSKTLAALSSPPHEQGSGDSKSETSNGRHSIGGTSDGDGGRELNEDFINSLRVEHFANNHPALLPRLAPAIEAGRGLEGIDHMRATLPFIEKLKKEREKEVLDWEESPQSAFNQEWYRKTRKDYLVEAKVTKTHIQSDGPGFSFRCLPSGEGARFDYAWLPTCHEDAIPRPEQWRRVPSSAWRPGRELKFTNQARRGWGKEPLTAAQWAAIQAEREVDEAPARTRSSRRKK